MTPAPTVIKHEYVCMAIDDDMLQMMDDVGTMKEDVKFPIEWSHLSDVCKTIKKILGEEKKECLIQVQRWGEKEQAVGAREGQDL